MRNMFYGCSSLANLDVSKFDTSNVIDMSGMFYECYSLPTLNVSGFKTNKVVDMKNMFSCCSISSLDVSNFDTGNVTDMNSMFGGCFNLNELDLSNFNTSNVTDMGCMFCGCNSLKSLNISNFDTTKVANMDGMFAGCQMLSELDLSSFDMGNVKNVDNMFHEMLQQPRIIVSSKGKNVFLKIINGIQGVSLMLKDNKDFIVYSGKNGGCSWDINKNGLLRIYPTNGKSGILDNSDVYRKNNGYSTNVPWFIHHDKIKAIKIESGVKTNSSAKGMFAWLENCEEIDLSELDTSMTKDMTGMFYGCKSLKSLDFTNLNLSKVTNAKQIVPNKLSLCATYNQFQVLQNLGAIIPQKNLQNSSKSNIKAWDYNDGKENSVSKNKGLTSVDKTENIDI